MKYIVSFLIVFIFAANVSAQKAETFDIISFKTPSGWQKEVNQKCRSAWHGKF